MRQSFEGNDYDNGSSTGAFFTGLFAGAIIGAGIGGLAAAIALAAKLSDRGSLRARLDPEYGEEIVPDPIRRETAAFSAEDEAHLRAVFARRLRHAFGYAGLRSKEATTGADPEAAQRASPRTRDEAR